MWTRKAAIMLAGGISLILIGMMISNFQLMIIGLTFIAFISINGWIEGHSDLEITRFVPHSNVYKGDLVEVTLTITNNSYKRTQQLEVFDNVPHEMKLRRGINQMRLNLGPGQTTKIEYKRRQQPCVVAANSDQTSVCFCRHIVLDHRYSRGAAYLRHLCTDSVPRRPRSGIRHNLMRSDNKQASGCQ